MTDSLLVELIEVGKSADKWNCGLLAGVIVILIFILMAVWDIRHNQESG